jgi:hypothetical protein
VITPNDEIAVSVISQLTRDLAFIKEKVNLIEERLESLAASVDEIELNL